VIPQARPSIGAREEELVLDTTDGQDTWGAIGVSENIIEASWEALVDSLEAGMLPSRVRGPAVSSST
jgi:hypothetical protein